MNYNFERFIQYFNPELYEHLDEMDMKTEYFTFKWCLTLYSCFLPAELVINVFDLFVLEGWPSIYEIGISMINNFMGEKLLKMESMMDISHYFRVNIRAIKTFKEDTRRKIFFGTHNLNLEPILPLLKE